MRHLKSYNIFELKTSTYLSAADKLDNFHPSRAEKLRKWADEKQQEFEDDNVYYLDPRTFYINNDVYYITNISDEKYNGFGNLSDVILHKINVTMSSTTTDDRIEIVLFNNREVINTDIKDDGTVFTNVKIVKKDEWEPTGEYRRRFDSVTKKEFWLNNRVEARAFIQIIENELGIKLELKANEIYKSIS